MQDCTYINAKRVSKFVIEKTLYSFLPFFQKREKLSIIDVRELYLEITRQEALLAQARMELGRYLSIVDCTGMSPLAKEEVNNEST